MYIFNMQLMIGLDFVLDQGWANFLTGMLQCVLKFAKGADGWSAMVNHLIGG